ncbi:MAG: radical SAM protein [Thermodesulfobacteriota bacterium]|nr:radical SAM protein [Thermodesulfobacteriota bacterium]
MLEKEYRHLPRMLYADATGQIYDHPFFRMTGFSGSSPAYLTMRDLVPVPEFSKMFYIPGCPPVGLDPFTGEFKIVFEAEVNGVLDECYAVSVFLEPGLVRTHLPAVDYTDKDYTLPMWAYTAVGFMDERYWATAFRIEYDGKWDPANYDDTALVPAIQEFKDTNTIGPLFEHLINCATDNHCFAAKNLFLKRWEAPLPVSRRCNASCLGCLSLQQGPSCEASHQRISFRPSQEEIVLLAVQHLKQAPEAIVSFGQGCEGEPLTEHLLIADSIREIRRQTKLGTINLNTNGSRPERIRRIAESGLDSIRISLNSARPDLYRAYYRPLDYDFDDVVASIALSKEIGLFTMVNHLVFPGITDQDEEIKALKELIRETGLKFIHFKNLNIDPQLYLEKMPKAKTAGIGLRQMVGILRKEFPDLQVGYFNKPVKN